MSDRRNKLLSIAAEGTTLGNQIEMAAVASCTCGMKTSDILFHDEGCRYKRLMICAERADDVTAALAAAGAEVARLRGLLWFAWREFNAVSARSGAPLMHDGMLTCTEEWWSKMTKWFADAIGEHAQKPWPSPEAVAALAQLSAPEDRA